MHRRQVLTGLGASALALASPIALAQDAFPSRPLRFVNNFPPAGPSDILARSVADVLQTQWKQAVVVDNRAGAGGNLGADAVAKAPADGYTLLFGIDSTFTVNPHVYRSMPFKPADLKPVLVMAASGLLIGASTSALPQVKTLKDLIAEGKMPKGLSFSSGGNGSPGHLAAEQFTDAAQARVTHIPYKGNTPAVQAVVAGEVGAGMLATPGMLPHVKSGKVAALAVTSRERSSLAPEVPTVAELGLPQLEQEVLYVVMAPAATPEPIVAQLAQAITAALQRPDNQQRLAQLDMRWEGLTGAAASKRLAEASARYQRIVKATDMKLD
ncbi:tripartite tricarboxylate transporter substrate binding protein [Ideonella sp. DXS22W]|uniref:Tripartite tricarboxylate transporter substrate binding protein n=1 Tax=Pseudaquabacterium inlustre TaxID=2984192 RepID=A0ABU9CL28_9BURK